MSNLMNVNNVSEASMNSQEVTDYLNDWYAGKRTIRHDKVKQSIERLMSQGLLRNPPMGDLEYINNLGAKCSKSVYVFSGEQGMKDCITVVAQLSPEHTALIVDRWLELEKQAAAPKLPQTYLEALEAHLQSEKDKLALAAQIEQQRPKVEFAERLVDTDNTWTRRHAAKMIKVPQQKFNAWLKEIGHNENNRNAVPTQYAINRGYQTVVVGEANGVSYAGPQITMKGLLYYANKWYKKAVPGDVIKNIERAEDEVQESFRLK